MNLAQKILDSKMTDEERQTPAVRAITLYEKERELQINNMVIQAIKTSTETGVGRAIVQKITDELNLEIDALVPDVRFLYELVTRMERQFGCHTSCACCDHSFSDRAGRGGSGTRHGFVCVPPCDQTRAWRPKAPGAKHSSRRPSVEPA